MSLQTFCYWKGRYGNQTITACEEHKGRIEGEAVEFHPYKPLTCYFCLWGTDLS